MRQELHLREQAKDSDRFVFLKDNMEKEIFFLKQEVNLQQAKEADL